MDCTMLPDYVCGTRNKKKTRVRRFGTGLSILILNLLNIVITIDKQLKSLPLNASCAIRQKPNTLRQTKPSTRHLSKQELQSNQ